MIDPNKPLPPDLARMIRRLAAMPPKRRERILTGVSRAGRGDNRS
jgi:hypothetical protein